MKNIFVVTFGTSDVQFDKKVIERNGFEIISNKRTISLQHKSKSISISLKPNRDREDYFLLNSPRIDGEIVFNHITDFLPIIEIPLTLPVIQHLKLKNPELSIDKWFLFDTNQEKDKVKENHWRNDTLYISWIFKAKIQYLYPAETDEKFEIHTISEDLTNIDRQYLDFKMKCPGIFNLKEEEINQIIYLPQGGIDQINQALTLQLIQAYKTKVKQWQKAEDAEPNVLHFTYLFLNDLNKQKILKHLEDYDFGLIANSGIFNREDEVFRLSEFAYKKLNLDYDNLDRSIKYYEEDNTENRSKDLFIYSKIFLRKGDYGNYLWRLFTLLENIYRMKVDMVFGSTEKLYIEAKNQPGSNNWIKKIKEIPGLEAFLNKKEIYKNRNLEWRIPNRFAYKHIYNFFIENNYLTDEIKVVQNINYLFNKSKLLADLRNDLAHYLRPITLNIIEDALPKGISLYDLNKKWDEVFYIEDSKPFGIYEDITVEIKNLL